MRGTHVLTIPLTRLSRRVQVLVFYFANGGNQAVLLYYSSRTILQVFLPTAIVQPITVVPTPNITGT